MKVFISWSGERSGRLANLLVTWLPRVIQALKPWVSSNSIDAGARWNDEVARALEELQCGVICLTPENLASPWILFEAGALSKAVSASRVIPYLLGFEPRELQGPLSQFQAVRADEGGTFRLLTALNNASGQPPVPPDALSETFQVWWPRLESQIEQLVLSSPGSQPVVPSRSVEDMMGEVLELLRSQRLPQEVPDSREEHVSLPVSERTIGSVVRSLRTKRRWSPGELAARAGISKDELLRIESGAILPSENVLRQLGAAFGVDLFAFVDSVVPNQEGTEPAV
jgi:DNA-binding XRE family transcriptional regulator